MDVRDLADAITPHFFGAIDIEAMKTKCSSAYMKNVCEDKELKGYMDSFIPPLIVPDDGFENRVIKYSPVSKGAHHRGMSWHCDSWAIHDGDLVTTAKSLAIVITSEYGTEYVTNPDQDLWDLMVLTYGPDEDGLMDLPERYNTAMVLPGVVIGMSMWVVHRSVPAPFDCDRLFARKSITWKER